MLPTHSLGLWGWWMTTNPYSTISFIDENSPHGSMVTDCRSGINTTGNFETSRISEESRGDHRTLQRLLRQLTVKSPAWRQNISRQTFNKYLVSIFVWHCLESHDIRSSSLHRYSSTSSTEEHSYKKPGKSYLNVWVTYCILLPLHLLLGSPESHHTPSPVGYTSESGITRIMLTCQLTLIYIQRDRNTSRYTRKSNLAFLQIKTFWTKDSRACLWEE